MRYTLKTLTKELLESELTLPTTFDEIYDEIENSYGLEFIEGMDDIDIQDVVDRVNA